LKEDVDMEDGYYTNTRSEENFQYFCLF